MAEKMEEEMSYECSVFRAPCEGMNKDFRQVHKSLEKDVSSVIGAVGDMSKVANIDKEQAAAHIDKLVNKLQGLKRKVAEAQLSTTSHISSFKSRVDHFKSNLAKGNVNAYNQARTDRVLVDYMLRAGFYDSAIRLAQEANITGLVDIDIFISSKKVIEGLKKHDCSEALQWCADNRSKLKKINSDLEFSLRIQEFIELIRTGKLEAAIGYSRKHLAPCASTNLKEIQKAMAALAFPTNTACARYKPLFDPQRWEDLITRFQHDCYALNSLTLRPLLAISLQAGLSALKTTACVEAGTAARAAYAAKIAAAQGVSLPPLPNSPPLPSTPAPTTPPTSSQQQQQQQQLAAAAPASIISSIASLFPPPATLPIPIPLPQTPPAQAPAASTTTPPPPGSSKNPNCPVCNDQFNILAAPLPVALHSHSCLVCRVTGAIMNEDNPPVALPNGYVYSRNAINQIAARNGGKVVCPITGLVCKMEELRKVFIS